MIELERSKNHKWILQKNISSKSLLIDFVGALNDQDNIIDAENIKEQLKDKQVYRGRSETGNAGTMGVRLSQACFYMFGYKKNDKFFPTPMSNLLLDKDRKLTIQQIALINLYSMQFPSPYSNTIDDFTIYIGRLLIKLLLDKRLDEKLYIDECIFFLMFLEHVDEEIYEELVESILEFRSLSFEEKLKLLDSHRVSREKIILDPGIGFGKSNEESIEIIKNTDKIGDGELPVLMALSRKRCIGQMTGREIKDRLAGTLAANILCVQKGAKIVRVHDLCETIDALNVMKYLQ